MKFTIKQPTFNAAISTASRAVSSRPSRPVLGNILAIADAETQSITLTGFDEVIGIEVSADAKVETPGSITLPAKLLGDIIARLPDDELTITVANDTATIKSAAGKYQVRGMNAEDYPMLPTVEAEPVEIQPDTLLGGLQGTLFAVSGDETKQVLTGVHLAATGKTLEFCGTDGHRLAIRTFDVDEESPDSATTIPAKALREVERALTNFEGGTVTASIDSTMAVFSIGNSNTSITTRVLEGQYPNYRGLLPKSFACTATLHRRELIGALERVAILAAQKNDIIKMSFDSLTCTISVEAMEVGSAQETIGARFEGESLGIAFNVRYLLDGLKSFSSNEVVFQMNAATSPAVLNPVGDSGATYLVMPVQIKS